MGMFQDTLAGMRGEDGSLTIGEDFEGTLTSAYDADMTGPTAAVEQAQVEIAELKAQLVAAQAANWILVQDGYGLDGAAAPGEGDGEGGGDSDPDNSENDGDPDPDDIDEDDFLGEDNDKDND